MSTPETPRDELHSADPDALLEPLQKPRFWPWLIWSVVGHAVIIAILSIGYIHGSLVASPPADDEPAEQAEAPANDTAEEAPADTPVQEGDEDEEGLSPIERDLQETSDERPDESPMDLDDMLDDIE
jgi:flagellar biosynthesis/type III secretory pathway M-ring protein FliF/YscJ